jgi:hypothetical protein
MALHLLADFIPAMMQHAPTIASTVGEHSAPVVNAVGDAAQGVHGAGFDLAGAFRGLWEQADRYTSADSVKVVDHHNIGQGIKDVWTNITTEPAPKPAGWTEPLRALYSKVTGLPNSPVAEDVGGGVNNVKNFLGAVKDTLGSWMPKAQEVTTVAAPVAEVTVKTATEVAPQASNLLQNDLSNLSTHFSDVIAKQFPWLAHSNEAVAKALTSDVAQQASIVKDLNVATPLAATAFSAHGADKLGKFAVASAQNKGVQVVEAAAPDVYSLWDRLNLFKTLPAVTANNN